MELTDEQYCQVLRYVDGEMDAAESNAFEAVLIQNIALHDEVEFYKEIRTISESVEQKICNIDQVAGEDKTGSDEVLQMIKKARANWEITDKNDLKKEHFIPPGEVKNISNQQVDNIRGMNGEPELGSEKGNVWQSVKEEGGVRRMYRYKWLAAAVFIGFISLSITFWYFQSRNDDARIAYNKKEPKREVDKNKNPGSQEKITNTDTTSRQVLLNADKGKLVAKNFERHHPILPTRRDITHAPVAPDSSVSNSLDNGLMAEKAEREKLVAKNFERDNLPSQIPEPLEDPSIYYKDHKTKDAIAAYKKVLAEINETENSGLTARGDDKIDLITFYAHYYLAQSYMSINNMTNAIQEFENASKIAPDTTTWKNKVQWYLALAYLKTGQIQSAEKLLKEVADREQANDYKQRAIELINELRKK